MITIKKIEYVANKLRQIADDMLNAADGIRPMDIKTDKGQKMLRLILRQTKRKLSTVMKRI